MYRKRNYKSDKRKYEDKVEHGYDGKPSPEKETKPSLTYSDKALKNLPNSSYSVIADPYTAALPGSRPYPIINIFNKCIGGSYAGENNLDGGNVQQYANSVASKMLQVFDCMRLKTKINYNFIPTTPVDDPTADYPGKQLINEIRNAIAEAISILKSTTYTQMAINNYVVETDLPMGDAEN